MLAGLAEDSHILHRLICRLAPSQGGSGLLCFHKRIVEAVGAGKSGCFALRNCVRFRKIDFLRGDIGNRLQHQARRVAVRVSKAAESHNLACLVVLQRGIGHAIQPAHQRGGHRVACASQAHSRALVVSLRKQAIERLEVLALVQRHRGPCRSGIRSRIVVCRLNLQHTRRSGLALCSLRIGKPDAVHLKAARRAVFHNELIEPGHNRALDLDDLSIERRGALQNRADSCVNSLGKNSAGARANKQGQHKYTLHRNLSSRSRSCTDNENMVVMGPPLKGTGKNITQQPVFSPPPVTEPPSSGSQSTHRSEPPAGPAAEPRYPAPGRGKRGCRISPPGPSSPAPAAPESSVGPPCTPAPAPATLCSGPPPIGLWFRLWPSGRGSTEPSVRGSSAASGRPCPPPAVSRAKCPLPAARNRSRGPGRTPHPCPAARSRAPSPPQTPYTRQNCGRPERP